MNEPAGIDDKRRIFISYAHPDSKLVHRIVKQLESHGIPCWMYERDALPGISYLQQTGQVIADSLAVLLIVSKESLKSDQITKEVVRAHEERRHIFPILVNVEHEVFRTSQPEWREAIGASVSMSLQESTIPDLCHKIIVALERIGETSYSTESPLFSPHLYNAFSALNQKIEALTSEQLRVLNQLGYSKRVRISGCAGSGKTLVAVEKASRLDAAGLRVAVLCHSPHLARYLSALLYGTKVDVESFGQWVRRFSSEARPIPEKHWTHTHEPSSEEINTAFDAIASSQNRYDAIIVDEAQDFRPEWWYLIEAAIPQKSAGILYLFHDDKQKLEGRNYVPEYPVDEPHLDLSRNIRNAGNVHKAVKFYNRASPPIEEELWGMGSAVALDLPFSDPGLCLQIALCRVRQHYPQVGRLLLIYPESAISLLPGRPPGPYEISAAWQEAVFVHLLKIIEAEESFDLSQKQQWRHRLHEMCSAMSLGHEATAADVKRVNRFVASLNLPKLDASNARWAVQDHQLQVRTGSTGVEHFRKCIGLFLRPNWHKSLPIAHFGSLAAEDVLISTPGSAKGLEADVTVMLVERYDAYTETEYYIAISRARHSVFFVLAGKESILPHGFRENLVDYYRRVSAKG